jgi:uncharacterized protein (TIGR02391 family)
VSGKKTKRNKPDIEMHEVLAETGRRGYETLRLARIRYQNNPYSFIDLRLFQRGYDENGSECHFPTRKGIQIKEEQFQRLIGKWTLVPSVLFHPTILKRAFPALRREEFDTAVFRAFKALEVEVRSLSRLPAELVGTKLMRKAFDPQTGVLTDRALPMAEQEATAHLFAGAIGCYKNPHSHRDVNITFNEAFEMLLLASHLMHVLDRIQANHHDVEAL